MAKIFISYSRDSQAIARGLTDDIEALGNSVWFDQELTGEQAAGIGSDRECQWRQIGAMAPDLGGGARQRARDAEGFGSKVRPPYRVRTQPVAGPGYPCPATITTACEQARVAATSLSVRKTLMRIAETCKPSTSETLHA